MREVVRNRSSPPERPIETETSLGSGSASGDRSDGGVLLDISTVLRLRDPDIGSGPTVGLYKEEISIGDMSEVLKASTVDRDNHGYWPHVERAFGHVPRIRDRNYLAFICHGLDV